MKDDTLYAVWVVGVPVTGFERQYPSGEIDFEAIAKSAMASLRSSFEPWYDEPPDPKIMLIGDADEINEILSRRAVIVDMGKEPGKRVGVSRAADPASAL